MSAGMEFCETCGKQINDEVIEGEMLSIAMFGVRLPKYEMSDDICQALENNTTLDVCYDVNHNIYVGRMVKTFYGKIEPNKSNFVKLTTGDIEMLEYRLKACLTPFDMWKDEDFGMWVVGLSMDDCFNVIASSIIDDAATRIADLDSESFDDLLED